MLFAVEISVVGGCVGVKLAVVERKFIQINRKNIHQKVTKHQNTHLAQEVPKCRWVEAGSIYWAGTNYPVYIWCIQCCIINIKPKNHHS